MKWWALWCKPLNHNQQWTVLCWTLVLWSGTCLEGTYLPTRKLAKSNKLKLTHRVAVAKMEKSLGNNHEVLQSSYYKKLIHSPDILLYWDWRVWSSPAGRLSKSSWMTGPSHSGRCRTHFKTLESLFCFLFRPPIAKQKNKQSDERRVI